MKCHKAAEAFSEAGDFLINSKRSFHLVAFL